MLRAGFTAVSVFYRTPLLPIEVLHCGNKKFRAFLLPDLDLDPVTFIYELDPRLLKMTLHTKHELFTSKLSKLAVLHTDIQPATLLRRHIASGNK